MTTTVHFRYCYSYGEQFINELSCFVLKLYFSRSILQEWKSFSQKVKFTIAVVKIVSVFVKIISVIVKKKYNNSWKIYYYNNEIHYWNSENRILIFEYEVFFYAWKWIFHIRKSFLWNGFLLLRKFVFTKDNKLIDCFSSNSKSCMRYNRCKILPYI